MSGWVNEWVGGCLGQRVSGLVGGWVYGSVGQSCFMFQAVVRLCVCVSFSTLCSPFLSEPPMQHRSQGSAMVTSDPHFVPLFVPTAAHSSASLCPPLFLSPIVSFSLAITTSAYPIRYTGCLHLLMSHCLYLSLSD